MANSAHLMDRFMRHDEPQRRASIIASAMVTRKGQLPAFYDCGICAALHSIKWDGDCREDAARFFPEQLDESFGPLGWREVEMPT